MAKGVLQTVYGWRAPSGYTSPPAATEVFPYEFYKIVPDGVTLVLHTLLVFDRSDAEIGRGYEYSLRICARVVAAARRLIQSFPETDIIHIYSPHYVTAGATAKLERELGVNVLASLQAIVWGALRRVGIEDKLHGFGRLLPEH